MKFCSEKKIIVGILFKKKSCVITTTTSTLQKPTPVSHIIKIRPLQQGNHLVSATIKMHIHGINFLKLFWYIVIITLLLYDNSIDNTHKLKFAVLVNRQKQK